MQTNWVYLADGSLLAQNARSGRALRVVQMTDGYGLEDISDEGRVSRLADGVCKAEAMMMAMEIVQVPATLRRAA